MMPSDSIMKTWCFALARHRSVRFTAYTVAEVIETLLTGCRASRGDRSGSRATASSNEITCVDLPAAAYAALRSRRNALTLSSLWTTRKANWVAGRRTRRSPTTRPFLIHRMTVFGCAGSPVGASISATSDLVKYFTASLSKLSS